MEIITYKYIIEIVVVIVLIYSIILFAVTSIFFVVINWFW